MTIPPVERRSQGRHGLGWAVRRLLALAFAALLFGAGVAVGEALHDNPKPGLTVTSLRTLHP
jgi:hypothetical protein